LGIDLISCKCSTKDVLVGIGILLKKLILFLLPINFKQKLTPPKLALAQILDQRACNPLPHTTKGKPFRKDRKGGAGEYVMEQYNPISHLQHKQCPCVDVSQSCHKAT
jgi:hypothetical protein